MRMPTVIRKMPSARPRNGAVTTSTSLRYSVSAMRTPAISAPRIGERPTAPVAMLARMTTSRLTARNSSGLLVRAAWANRGGRSSRPPTSSAGDHQRALPGDVEQAARRARGRRCRTGTAAGPAPDPRTAASPGRRGRPGWSSPQSAGRARSTTWPARSPARWRFATASPMAKSAPPISAAPANSSAAPTPNTAMRMATSRRKLSSSPIENSSRTMPSSANGLDRLRIGDAEIVEPRHTRPSARRARTARRSSRRG